ncbi:hypothetical protein BXU08_01570 [Sphingomonas sp. LM7]|nr:hypothetical protein BXU08_01570 [Sphingomonas sp. LM7]
MQSFANVTADVWNCCKSKASSYGVEIGSDSGSTSSHGFTVSWNYDASSQVLQLQVTDKPFWAPCSLVNSKIHDAVDECYANHGASGASMIA